MRRAVALLCLLATACIEIPGPPIAATELSVRVRARAETVELGAPFPLTVVLVWDKDLEPREWNEDALAPLVVRLERRTRREDAHRVEERRSYRAHAFARGDVLVEPAPFRASPRNGGAEVVAQARTVRLRVTPLLDPEAPGDVELPGPPLRHPVPWLPIAGGAFAIAIGAVVLGMRRRRAPAANARPTETPRPPPPHTHALARLDALRAREPGDRAELLAVYAEAADVVRVYTQRVCGLDAPHETNEELVANRRVIRRIAARQRRALAAFLAHCDGVRFGRGVPEAAERHAQLDAARRFVTDTVRETVRDDVA